MNEDEGSRRRRRTDNYCTIWGVPLPSLPSPVWLVQDLAVPSSAAVRTRTLIECLLALKGQDLTQHEVFAFADAYQLWDAVTVEENDIILDPDPHRDTLLQIAWRFERANVLGWALGLIRHLHFPLESADGGAVIGELVPKLATATPELRDLKELADSADIARRLSAVCAAARQHNTPLPGKLHPGVVFERDQAFAFLTGETSGI